MLWRSLQQLLLLILLCVASSWQPTGVDPYEVLGLKRGDSLDSTSLKKAYRKAALRWHPDKVPEPEREEAERRFVEIAWAYELLGDPVRRRAFDEPPSAQPPPPGQEGAPHRDFSMEKAAKVFKDVFGDASEEYHDLINHLASSSSVGSQEEWKRHAKAIAKAMKQKRGQFSVETQSEDGAEKMKTSHSVQENGQTTVRKTVTTVEVTSSTSSGQLPHVDKPPLANDAHASAHDAHMAAMAAHHAAHAAAVQAAQASQAAHTAALAAAGTHGQARLEL
eukprot:TRINITY_DN96032_c0_g1_i1.p1 TRINITY_DN96032_c0_g1~~TRINITY_DN96032_c0_g1_i1.p1  ORF type:complete len:291 (-),score=77.31 TRINITY_DN96032_c0_g1_i1:11-844(-)